MTIKILAFLALSAHKRVESIQDVPISITAFSGDFLTENGMLLDTETFEVLRGPQGTLFGNNLTDEDSCQHIFDQALGGLLGAVDAANDTSVQRCVLGAPQTWNLRATFRFYGHRS